MIRRFGLACLLSFLAITATAQQLVTNGGFESGSTGWATSGNFYIGALPNPHNGSRYAYLSNPDGSWGNNLYGTLSQSFTVPNNISSATLSFWISIGTNEPTSTGHDFLTAYLGPSNTLLTNLSNANSGGYQQYSFNITAFAGQTVTLQFVGTTNSTYTTTFRVDDVSATYVASAPAPPTNLQVVGVTGAILMQWQNNATNATNVEIQRAALGGSFGQLATIGATSAAYRDVVAIGNIMCYEVRATNNNGVSAWVGPLCGTSIGPPALSYPPDNATLTNATVNLSWQSALAANQYGVDVGRSCGGTEILNNASSGGQVSYNLPVSPGTYVWRVRSANSNYPGVSDPSACRTFTIGSAPPPVPTANFTWSPQAAIKNQSVTFTDQSTNATSWSWNFGDGGTSSLQNPSHTYASSGNLTVTLTATNSSGSNTASKTVAVIGPPVASFSVSPSSPVVNQQVTFTDNSSGNPATWSWNFGDGQTSTAQNPTHSYASTGSYTATLTVANAAGSNSTTRQVSVGSTVVPPTAAFSWSPPIPTPGQQISFVDGSTGGPTSWTWTFGDNATSSAENPVHTYANAGTYHVTLAAANSAGSNTIAHDVSVTTGGVAPVADFSFQPSNPTTATTVTFTDASTGGPTLWTWDFNDGSTASGSGVTHKFSNPGSYAVKLTAANSAGSNQKTRTVMVTPPSTTPPNAEFSWSPQFPPSGSTVTFNDLSQNAPTSWQWTFGDNAPGSASRNPSHVFAVAGTYTVTLTASNGGGQSVRTHSLTVGAPPSDAIFSVDKASPLVGETIRFTASAKGGSVDNWEWNFGDGATGLGQMTTHSFTVADTYAVSVVAENKFGTAAASARITVSTGTPPRADFTYTPANPTVQDNVKFADTSTGNPFKWSWSIDGSSAGSLSSLAYQFATSGNHSVSLDVYNQSGHASATRTIYVGTAKYAVGTRVAAKVDFPGSNLSIRRGDTGTLVCTAASPGYEAFVNWDKPVDPGNAGFSPCANTAYPHHGWGVAMTELEKSSTPAPAPPMCSPGEVSTRACVFSAQCEGIQMRTCSLAGDGWSEWSECGLGSACTTPLPSVTTTKDGLLMLQQMTREEVETPNGGTLTIPGWVPIPYKFSAVVTAVISSHRDPITQANTIVIRRIDQSISVTPQSGPYGDPCKARGGITVDVYDGAKYLTTVRVDKIGSYFVSPGTTIFGGYTDTSISAAHPVLHVRLIVSPQPLTDCATPWANDWQKSLN